MKKIIILALLAISLDGMAQYRLGITKHDLKKEFPDLKYLNNTNDTIVYHRVSSLGDMYYYLTNNIVFMTAVTPSDNMILKECIKEYDLKYIKATPNTWEQYTPNGIVTCLLSQGDDHKWTFIFYSRQ